MRVGLSVGVVCLLAFVSGIEAADLIEPWGSGFSDIEFYAGGNLHGAFDDSAAVFGFGAPHGFSIGLLFNHYQEGVDEIGAVAIWTNPAANLDFWFSAATSLEKEEEPGDISWDLGMEWSRELLPGSIVYFRPSYIYDGSRGRVHPLLGVMRKISIVELHLEISSEDPEHGPWPLQLALGPNFSLSKSIEILPEFSWTWDRSRHERDLAFTLGFILTL